MCLHHKRNVSFALFLPVPETGLAYKYFFCIFWLRLTKGVSDGKTATKGKEKGSVFVADHRTTSNCAILKLQESSMATRVMLNGREVTNPATKALIAATVMTFVGVFLGLVIFLILPLIGLALSVGAGIAILGSVTFALGAGTYKVAGTAAKQLTQGSRRMVSSR